MGQNPLQLFNEPHPKSDLKPNLRVFNIFDKTTIYKVQQYVTDDTHPSPIIRMYSKDQNNFIIININNELVKKTLLPAKKKYKTVDKPKTMYRYFNIYSGKNCTFNSDPNSVFTSSYETLVSCRNIENNFVIYRLPTLEIINTISFHKVL